MRWILTTLAAMCIIVTPRAPSGALGERATDPTGVVGAHAADPLCASACPVRVSPSVHHVVRSLPPFTVAASAALDAPRARSWQAPRFVPRQLQQARRASVSSRGPPLV
jgi:hypothetical protein